MSFEKNFCSSPWFHMRINNSGTYEYCRWIDHSGLTRINLDQNIAKKSPLEYFQQGMAPIRQALLDGQPLEKCSTCYRMEQHGKVSGRQRQLLKVGVQTDHFAPSLASSTFKSAFDYSDANQGHTLKTVVDWQIDLGNYCNGACVFCRPESSSRLATEFKRIGIINQVPPRAWCDDPVLLEKFIADLKQCEYLQYLHFIGGETVITPGFKRILQSLIDADLAQNVTVGFTTNLTVWDDELTNDILPRFKNINLGLSIETLTPVNDYVRYPGKQNETFEFLERWRILSQQHGWLTQLRITPSCLTIHEVTSVYDYAWQHNLAIESCNFLTEPKFMRISVLPQHARDRARDRLLLWLADHPVETVTQIVNTRDPNLVHQQLHQDARSYVDYLDNSQDESHRLPDLITYLKQLEASRGNRILDYIPEYEQILRSHGY
jgi:sulfatase maturation enzyme AslB (radical SAM superfamily)